MPTNPGDVDTMSESEFFDFVVGGLEEVARGLNRAVAMISDSNEQLEAAFGVAPPKPRLTLVKEADDAS